MLGGFEHRLVPTNCGLPLGRERITDQSRPALQVPRPARCLTSGDLDSDGHPEIAIVNLNQPPTPLKNIPKATNAIVVSLIHAESNRSAIGAQVEVSLRGRRLTQAVMGGGSNDSQRDLTLQFGLGQTPQV